MLLDERITAGFKLDNNPNDETAQRIIDLDTAIERRIDGRWKLINPALLKLERELKACWDAQEVVMKNKLPHELKYEVLENLYRIAAAGKRAQETNAARNKLIREIDQLLGEAANSSLMKTYG